jgi:hypothetical protein
MNRQTEQARTGSQSVTERRSPWKRVPFVVPLILVNIAGLVGQSIWTYQQLAKHFMTDHHELAAVAAVLMGLAMESIAVYLAVQAHAAMMADQASGGLRMGSYAVGAVMAVINFNHFASAPVDSVALGVMFGIASLTSPWLWAVDSKAAHRAQLAARGVVDPRGVKLSTVRKLWHPILSLKVVRWAAWAGEVHPERAVAGWESERQSITQSAQTSQVSAHIEVASPSRQSTPVRAIQSAPSPRTELPVAPVSESTDSEEVTETVTETVTRTRTRSTRTETRIRVLTERVQSVQAHPDYQRAVESGTELTYDQIGAIIERTGRDVIKPVYLVLYRGQSVESVILGD